MNRLELPGRIIRHVRSITLIISIFQTFVGCTCLLSTVSRIMVTVLYNRIVEAESMKKGSEKCSQLTVVLLVNSLTTKDENVLTFLVDIDGRMRQEYCDVIINRWRYLPRWPSWWRCAGKCTRWYQWGINEWDGSMIRVWTGIVKKVATSY